MSLSVEKTSSQKKNCEVRQLLHKAAQLLFVSVLVLLLVFCDLYFVLHFDLDIDTEFLFLPFYLFVDSQIQ